MIMSTVAIFPNYCKNDSLETSNDLYYEYYENEVGDESSAVEDRSGFDGSTEVAEDDDVAEERFFSVNSFFLLL